MLIHGIFITDMLHSSQIQANNQTNKPLVFMNCGIHAREWVSPATCMYVIDQVAEHFVLCNVCAFMVLFDFFFSIEKNSTSTVDTAWLGAQESNELWIVITALTTSSSSWGKKKWLWKKISRLLYLSWKSSTLAFVRVNLGCRWNTVSWGTLVLFPFSLELWRSLWHLHYTNQFLIFFNYISARLFVWRRL